MKSSLSLGTWFIVAAGMGVAGCSCGSDDGSSGGSGNAGRGGTAGASGSGSGGSRDTTDGIAGSSSGGSRDTADGVAGSSTGARTGTAGNAGSTETGEGGDETGGRGNGRAGNAGNGPSSTAGNGPSSTAGNGGEESGGSHTGGSGHTGGGDNDSGGGHTGGDGNHSGGNDTGEAGSSSSGNEAGTSNVEETGGAPGSGGDTATGGIQGTAGSGTVSGWTSRGPGGGGALYSPTIGRHSPLEIYMATDMTAVFHTTDFGASWTTLPFHELRGGTHSQVRETSDPNTLYAVDYSNEDLLVVTRTTDGGATWNAIEPNPSPEGAYYLYADPGSTERFLVSDYSYIYYSSDGGATTSVAYSGYALVVGGVFWDGDDIYMGTSDGLVVSHDSGASFNLEAFGGIPSGERIVSFAGAKVGDAIRFFAVTRDGAWPGITGNEYGGYQGVYRLDLGDADWVDISPQLEADDGYMFLAMAENDLDTVYVAGGSYSTSRPVVAKTEDAGDTWSAVFGTENNSNIETGWSGFGGDTEWWFGEMAFGLAVAPLDSSRAILTDMGFVHVTANGGDTWQQAYVNPEDQNPAGSPTPRGHAYRTSGVDQTSWWWLTFLGDTTIFASLTDITSTRSDSSGVSWVRDSTDGLVLNSTYHAVQHPGTGTAYAATSSVHDIYESQFLSDDRLDGGEGAVMVSTDNARTWSTLHDFTHPVVWLALDPNNPERLYASVVDSAEGDLYVTNNLSDGPASTWERLASPPRTEGHPFVTHVLDDGTLIASYSGRRDDDGAFTTSSGFFVSDDGGDTWEDRSAPEMQRWTKDVVVDPHDAAQQTFYVAVFSHWGAYPNEVGGIYRTTDRGQNWTRISDLYRVESCAIDPRNPDRMYVTTETEGLWLTENLSADQPTFTQDLTYPFAHPSRVFFSPVAPEDVWITSFGGGLRLGRP